MLGNCQQLPNVWQSGEFMKRNQETTQTSAERKLARALRSRKLIFKENQYIEGYEVDFWFPDYQLAVEIDGYYHLSETRQKLDRQKDQFFMEKGVLLIRFSNQQIRDHLGQCAQEIQQLIIKITALKSQNSINDEWKTVLKNISFPKPKPAHKQPKSIEDYFLSLDDDRK
jgi:very-short-patch-repair endonuclease